MPVTRIVAKWKSTRSTNVKSAKFYPVPPTLTSILIANFHLAVAIRRCLTTETIRRCSCYLAAVICQRLHQLLAHRLQRLVNRSFRVARISGFLFLTQIFFSSFTQMLSQPKKVELWPSLNPTASPSWNSSGPSDSVARTQRISTRSSYNASDDNIDDDGDDLAAPPEFRSDFGTAIAVALEKQMFQSADGKTKKKKRNTVLFSTGLPGRGFKGN